MIGARLGSITKHSIRYTRLRGIPILGQRKSQTLFQVQQTVLKEEQRKSFSRLLVLVDTYLVWQRAVAKQTVLKEEHRKFFSRLLVLVDTYLVWQRAVAIKLYICNFQNDRIFY